MTASKPAFPESWLHARLEKASGVRAFPLHVPRGQSLPFVYFQREDTFRERDLMGNVGSPVASFVVAVFAKQYMQAKEMAAAIRLGVDDFSGSENGVTIQHASIVSENDAFPDYEDGVDTPTYGVEIRLEVRFEEGL